MRNCREIFERVESENAGLPHIHIDDFNLRSELVDQTEDMQSRVIESVMKQGYAAVNPSIEEEGY